MPKKGYKQTEATKRKIADAMMGDKNPRIRRDVREHINQIIQAYQQRIYMYEIAEKYNCSDALIRTILFENGVILKSSSEANTNERNPNWRGDGVGYFALHIWIQKNKPRPELCEMCHKKKKLELANISSQYHRDVNDFLWVCHKCNLNMHVPKHIRFIK